MNELKQTFDLICADLEYWQSETDSDDELQAEYARWEVAELKEMLTTIRDAFECINKYKGFSHITNSNQGRYEKNNSKTQ